MHSVLIKPAVTVSPEITQGVASPAALPPTSQTLTQKVQDNPIQNNSAQNNSFPKTSALKFPKNAIRRSLKASTVDAVFAAIFTITTTGATTGILLSNFLVELDASPIEVGMLCSIPMMVNLLQPLGAYFSERTTSRHSYCLWTHGIARIMWLFLAVAIGLTTLGWSHFSNHQLVVLTLLIILVSHVVTALGSASWLSWMAILVPRRLRGRYFGLRNSLASLTQLLSVPVAALIVSNWSGGSIQGYGVVLLLGIIAGMISLSCQFFKVDVNPQEQNAISSEEFDSLSGADPNPKSFDSDSQSLGSESLGSKSLASTSSNTQPSNTESLASEPLIKTNKATRKSIFKDKNFLIFLVYFGLWMFAFNLSTPFFNLYMLDTLDLDVSWVSLYGSFQAGAGMLMLIVWGRIADKFGNRVVLLLTGILIAITPIFWILIGNSSTDIWLWLPLLHIFIGGSVNAVELCGNNLQIAIAPTRNQSIYFAIAAAVAGGAGALGTTIGGFLAESTSFIGGLPGLFAISVGFRIVALIPLMFVEEKQNSSLSLTGIFQGFRQRRKLLARG
ncbi:MAG: MFS transporter [Mastigocoleus sp. MO_167.B18]|nr:MFS transporter [Mastigocoleus sp. MO_167.B18]